MNGFHFAHLGSRLAGLPRQRRVALATGLVVLSLAVISLAWLARSPRRSGQSRTIAATRADSPSLDRVQSAPLSLGEGQGVRADWPRYMPQLPATRGAVASRSPGLATITPAVIHGPPETVAIPPSIAAGPELFAPTIQPIVPATTQAQPSPQVAGGTPTLPVAGGTPTLAIAGGTPPPLVASRPDGPVPPPAVAPLPARLPVTRPMRSEAMEKIATQSDQQIRHGFELANRGAYFAARAEFTAALRLIAQGLDNEENRTAHSQALSAALTAMKEAHDFIPAGGKLEAELDLPPLVAAHRTPVLKNVPREQLQAMRALKQYLTFAQEQLAAAAGQEVSGSVALGALGKLHAALAGRPNPEIVIPEAKAIVFFQAAILVCPRNYIAANDLGVLLAHSGDLAGARRMLEHSVLVCRCSENLNNLSVVYRQVGQQRLAELAAEKARVAKAAEIARQKNASLSAGGAVEWVEPAALAQSPGQWADPARPAATAGPQDPAANRAPDKPVSGLLPVPFAPGTLR